METTFTILLKNLAIRRTICVSNITFEEKKTFKILDSPTLVNKSYNYVRFMVVKVSLWPMPWKIVGIIFLISFFFLYLKKKQGKKLYKVLLHLKTRTLTHTHKQTHPNKQNPVFLIWGAGKLQSETETWWHHMALELVAACFWSPCPIACRSLPLACAWRNPSPASWRRRTRSKTKQSHTKIMKSYLHCCFAVLMNVRMFFQKHLVR